MSIVSISVQWLSATSDPRASQINSGDDETKDVADDPIFSPAGSAENAPSGDGFVLTSPASTAVDFSQLAREVKAMTSEQKAKLERIGLEVRVLGDPMVRRFVEAFDGELVDAKKVN
jgi:hypothetical protein